MTYVFAGAFCEDRAGKAEALRAAFPASLRRRFTRADSTSDLAPDDLWCPKAGLLAVTQASKYTLGSKVFDREEPDPDPDEFMQVLERVLPPLAEAHPILALAVECFGGVCGASAVVYRHHAAALRRSYTPDRYAQGLVECTGPIGCNVHVSGAFPPLTRGAFHLRGQPF